jgi:hypothetical protein
MQQALLRYHGNATGRIGHATKETQHVTILFITVLMVILGVLKYLAQFLSFDLKISFHLSLTVFTFKPRFLIL